LKTAQPCQIRTPRHTVAAIDSGQFSHGSPSLVNGSAALVYGESLNPLNSTMGRGSEDDFVSNHYSPSSIGMSGSTNCKKRRSPISCQLDGGTKIMLFGQLTESNNLCQLDQVECDMSPQKKVVSCERSRNLSPQKKVVSCQRTRNLCLGGNALLSTDNQCESTFISISAAQSAVVESFNSGADRGGVLVQAKSKESSGLQTPKPVSDSSLCSSSKHSSKSAPIASKDIAENVYSIACNFCGNSFGLPEKQFLVRCTLASLSKSYLSILANGQQEFHSKVGNVQDRQARTSVVISDVAFLNQLFTRSGPQQCPLTSSSAATQRKSIWVEEDGCVFKALVCPQCEASNICVGVHVVATDVSNANLLDKVVRMSFST
ncbi:hypothetical protein KI387_042668, partial [Taxus chinensis]